MASTQDLKADLGAAFRSIVAARRAVRAFRPDRIPEATIREVFGLAQWGPSNGNTQPWTVMIASGQTRDRLRDAYLEEVASGRDRSPDIPYHHNLYPDVYVERQQAHVACQYEALEISRHDVEGRARFYRDQLSFFGAPHVALLFMPTWGNEREASDVGMYGQSVLLGLTAFGLAGLPQALLSYYARPAHRVLNVDDSLKLLFGISFGYEDTGQASARLTQPRASFDCSIKLLE